MNARYWRLLLVGTALFVVLLIDVILNDKLNPAIFTWVAVAVAFHLLALEAIFTKSKPLTFATWAVVALGSGSSVLYFTRVLDVLIIIGFLVGYTALLLWYLKLEFQKLNKVSKVEKLYWSYLRHKVCRGGK